MTRSPKGNNRDTSNPYTLNLVVTNPMPFLSRLLRSTVGRLAAGVLALSALIFAPSVSVAQAPAYPAWWQARGVLKTDGSVADDYAAINQGQLKNLVRGAVVEMNDHLPGGAGSELDLIIGITGWGTPTIKTDDYAAVNIGQLKNIAMKVYSRLIAVGFTTGYPWDLPNTPAKDDYAMANIGQAKDLFKFDVFKDPNNNGLPDWWEVKYGLTGHTAGDMAPGDVTYLEKYHRDLNPLAADTDGDGTNDGDEITQGTNPARPGPSVTLTAPSWATLTN